MKKLLLLAILATTMIFNVQAQVYKTIHVTTAGTLGSLLTDNEKGLVTNLTVSGNIDARDFLITGTSMPKLTALDISTVTIQAYNGYLGGTNSHPANEIPPYVFQYIVNQVKSIILPNSITSIADFAFSGCKGLTSINIPNGVKTIGLGAFDVCTGLTSISLPNSVTSIGQAAFSMDTGLTSVNIPSGVIGLSAFSNCTGLSSISFGSGVTSIGNGAFSGCTGLSNLTIPGSITSIGSAFYNCSGLTSITIGSGVTSIGDAAFYYCTGLTNVTIPNSVTSMGYAFYGCSGLTSITIGSGITSIAGNTFFGCTGLTNVTIPNSVTSIGANAFYGCTGLTSVTIGSGVTSIGNYFIYNCPVLKTINCLNSIPPTLGTQFFYSINDLFVTDVYVPTDAAVAAYKANGDWINTFPGNIIKKGSPSGISNLSISNLKVYTTAGGINIEGLGIGEKVTLYTVNGIQLRTLISEGTRIVLPALPNAVYLVKTPGKTCKVKL